MNRRRIRCMVAFMLLPAYAWSTESSWRPELYRQISPEAFLKLPAVNEPIDFDAIDFPLLHAAVLYLTNAERAQRGLRPLEYNPALERAARGHSADMRDRDFYGHMSPVRGKRTPNQRARAEGFRGGRIGENVAMGFGIQYQSGQSVVKLDGGHFSFKRNGGPIPPHTYLSAARTVVSDWMNSPGHRANILRPVFRWIGVGAVHHRDPRMEGMHRFHYTQKFGT